MKKLNLLAASILSIGLIACSNDGNKNTVSDPIGTPPIATPPDDTVITHPVANFSYDFNVENHNATVIFSDYPKDEETFYELTSAYENLPSTFSEMKGWKLSGSNRSDDLFMAIKIPVNGLLSAILYKATLTVDIVTNVSKNCAGIGGAPGESVFVKLAASIDEPSNELDNDDMYRINIDIGNQSQSGTEGLVVGNVANSIECGADEVYEKKTLSMTQSIDVMSDNDGKMWLTVGFDSGYEGITEVFITKLSANIVE
jgi:hypothetical protein